MEILKSFTNPIVICNFKKIIEYILLIIQYKRTYGSSVSD